MSSPLASLSKTRKVPLQSEPVNPGRRGVRIYRAEDEVDMPNDGQGSEERIAVPSCYGGIGAPVRSPGAAFCDPELLASMSRKLQELEQRVWAQTEEMLSKVEAQDRKILALEELVKALQQHQGKATAQRQELETLCVQLQQQVGEMERFLGDYGLQWVGEPVDQENSEVETVSEDDTRDRMTAKEFWKPGDSLVPPEVDFDRLLASLEDLSELMVEGDTQVVPVPGGARLHTLAPIPLTLYRNGFVMSEGPFRPFHDLATQVQLASPFLPLLQRCLRDILDGFFPSELQRLYPSGVSFKVSDLRNQVYPEDGHGPFPGEGRVVGWQSMLKDSDGAEVQPGTTTEKSLKRLPKCVTRQGEVVPVRGPIRDPLQEIVVETPALAAERQRSQDSPNTPAPPLCTLRVKSENGEQAFLLLMWPEDTIGTVRAQLAQARAMDAATFEIFSTFPPTVYQDDTLTLQAAGLVPSTMLLLRTRRAQPPKPDFGPSPE